MTNSVWKETYFSKAQKDLELWKSLLFTKFSVNQGIKNILYNFLLLLLGEGHVGKIQEHVQTFEKVASLEIFYTIFMHVDKKEVAKKSLWKNHLKNALESGMFTDVTIVCCDGEFQAHKLVLTANNEVISI